MRLAEADFSEHFAKGAFMQRFAVHNDAVHVKNDGRKLFHFKWFSGRSGNRGLG